MSSAIDYIKESKTKKISAMAENNLNEKDEKGRTALIRACEEGLNDLAMDLIRKGADINAKDNSGRTPLMIALEKGNDALAIALIGNGANMSALVGSNLLTSQFFKSHPEFIKFISANGATGDSLSGNALLIFTSEKSGTEALDAYIAAGGYINASTSPENKTLLMGFAENGNLEAFEKALEYGADINQCDINGRTALHEAAKNNNINIFLRGIENGADIINQRDTKTGNNALEDLINNPKTSQEDIIKIMKIQESTTGRPCPDTIHPITGKSISMQLAERGFPEVVKHMYDRSDTIEKTNINIDNNDNASFKHVIKLKSMDISTQDNLGNTALIYAMQSGNTECFKFMLEHNADIFIKNNNDANVAGMVHLPKYKEFKDVLEETLPHTNPAAYKIYTMRQKMGAYDSPPQDFAPHTPEKPNTMVFDEQKQK